MAVRVVHLLALLLVGYTLVTLEVYWILEDAHGGNHASAKQRGGLTKTSKVPDTDTTSSTAKVAAADNSAAGAETDQRPHGNLKGAREQDLVKQYTNVHAVKPVQPKILAETSTANDQAKPSAKARNAAAGQAVPDMHKSIRFPRYGTPQFTQLCPYTAGAALPPPVRPNCTLVIHPRHDSNEGLASWASTIVQGHLIARQVGCGIKFDYGPAIDVASLIVPYGKLGHAWEDRVNDWLIPPKQEGLDLDCTKLSTCYEFETATLSVKKLSNALRRNAVETPNYRYAYVGFDNRFNASLYEPLKTKLVGFDVKLGAACSLGMLFHPSPDIVKYEPTFFTSLLPALREEGTLVLAVYIRSGFADVATAAENRGKNATDVVKGHAQSHMEESVACAAALEEDMLSQDVGGKYGRVVWLVVSDSSTVKDSVSDAYGGRHVLTPTRSIPRDVLHTTAKGMHTRPKRDPSTVDFAAGFLDWYLLGESDLVITTGGIFSFGAVAAIRTARPLYSAVPMNIQNKRKEEGACQGVDCHCIRTYDASDEMARMMTTATVKL